MCTSSRARARPPPGIGRRGLEAPEHTAGDAADAQAGHIIEVVRLVGEDGACGAQPAADRRTDAFAEIPGGEPRGIPGDEGVLPPHDLHLTAQVVAVAGRLVLRPRGEPLLECARKMCPVRPDILATRLEAL